MVEQATVVLLFLSRYVIVRGYDTMPVNWKLCEALIVILIIVNWPVFATLRVNTEEIINAYKEVCDFV